MDSEVMITFNKALLSVTESKAPISKQKIFDITKAAMNAIRYFKHVVLAIEKFLVKCRSEHKLSGLYVMDSILRQAKKQYKHKDVFAPRFAVNLQNTFTNILTCDTNDRLKVVRVINLWQANEIFKDEVIDPLLQYCRASGLEVDVKKVEMCVKGEKANMQIYGADISQTYETKQPKTPPSSFVPKTPPMELRPQTPNQLEETSEQPTDNSLAERDVLSVLEALPELHQLTTAANLNRQLLKNVQKLMNERITEKLEIERRRQGNIKNLLSREFADDYSDEEEDEERTKNESSAQVFSKEHILSVAKSMLAEGVLSQELQQIHQQSTGQPRARTPPEANSHQQPFSFPPPNFSMPPPNGATFFTPIGVPPPAIQPGQMMHNFSTSRPPPQTASSSLSHESNGSDARGSSNRSRDQDRSGRKRERSRSRDHTHQHERGGDRDVRPRRDVEADSRSSRNDRSDRSRSDRRSGAISSNIQTSSSSDRRRRTRSPERGGGDRRSEHRSDRGGASDKDTRSRDSDSKEKERRKNGFPTHPKDDHVLIASRTLWFGKIPSNCSETDIREAVKDAGQPEKINIVAPRGCAYVTMRERRAAFKIIDRLGKDLQIQKKTVKISWATIPGMKENERLMDYWDSSRGIAQIPFSKLPERLDGLLEGAFMDIYTLPTHLKDLYDARGAKGQQGLIPLPATAGAGLPSADSAAMFSQGVLQQIQPPGLPLPANMFPFQQQLNVSSSSSTPQLMGNMGGSDQQQQQPPLQLPSAAMLAAFGFPQGLMPPPPASNTLNPAFNPQFMAAAAAAAGGLLPNPFTGGPGAPPPKALLPPPSANPPTPNFQQQNFRPPFGGNNRQPEFGAGGGMDSRGGRGGNFRGTGPPRGFNSFNQERGGFRGRGAGGNFQRFDSPQSNNFNQARGGGRGGGRGGHWNGPADSFANSPGGFGGAGGQDFRNNESGFRGNRGGRFNSFPARGGPPSNNNFRGGRFNSGSDRPPSLFDAPPVRHHQDQQFGSGGFPPRHAFSNSGSESTAPPNQKSPSGGAGLLPTPLFPPATTRQFTRFSSINDTSAGDSAAPGTSPPASFTQHTPMAAEDVKQASESLSNSMREQHDRNQPFTSGGQETEEFTVSTTQQVEQQPRDMPTQQHHNQGRNQSEVSRAEVEVSSTTFHDEHQQQQLVGPHADSVSQPQQQPQPKEHQLFEQEQKQENAAQEAPQTTED